MKTYRFNYGRIFKGLKVYQDNKFGNVVLVGEEGRGRHLKKVGLLRQDPPSINEEKEIQNAAAVKITNRRTQQKFSLLKSPTNNEDQRILILVSSDEGYKRNCEGTISFLQGGDKPENLIAEGHGAYGDAGRVGFYQEKLLVLEKGNILKINTTKYNTWIVAYLEDAPEVFSAEDWEMKEAVEETQLQIQEI